MTGPAVDATAAIQIARVSGWPTKDASGDDLVGEGESQGEVHVEMHDPPRLVLEPPSERS